MLFFTINKNREVIGSNYRGLRGMVFPVVIYGCENWTIKKSEYQRIDAFELLWKRLLRVP